MQHGQIILGREQRRRLLAAGIRFFLAAALTASKTPGDMPPLHWAVWLPPGRGRREPPRWQAPQLGSGAVLNFREALPFLAVAVLIFTTAQAFRGSRLLEKRRWLALITGGFFWRWAAFM